MTIQLRSIQFILQKRVFITDTTKENMDHFNQLLATIPSPMPLLILHGASRLVSIAEAVY